MIAEALAYLHDAPIIEQPVLCSRCSAVLVEAMAEEARDAEIEAGDGLTIFYLFDERVCRDCFESDEFEARYRRADLGEA